MKAPAKADPSESSVRVIVAEDDDHAREYVGDLVREHSDLELGAAVSNAVDLRAAIGQAATDGRPFELAILDIDLRGVQVFDVLRKIPPSRRPAIILFSAYRDFGPEAFELRAVDYLMKPCEEPRFYRAVDRAVSRILRRRDRRLQFRGQEFGLLLPSGGEMRMIAFEEIIYLQANDKQTIVRTEHESLAANKALTELAGRLPVEQFMRVHRRFVVNLRRIAGLRHVTSGSYSLRLRCEPPADVSVGATYSKTLIHFLEG
ncbi:MAG: LytTR family DNA-binding domain-containing protein [Leptospirales bacterium]|jgi:DNA-binding LytR/AlgR family response regulator